MLREIVVPDSSKIVLPIPKSYINRKIEILIFPLESKIQKKTVKRKAGSAKGLFTINDDFDAPIENFKEYMP